MPLHHRRVTMLRRLAPTACCASPRWLRRPSSPTAGCCCASGRAAGVARHVGARPRSRRARPARPRHPPGRLLREALPDRGRARRRLPRALHPPPRPLPRRRAAAPLRRGAALDRARARPAAGRGVRRASTRRRSPPRRWRRCTAPCCATARAVAVKVQYPEVARLARVDLATPADRRAPRPAAWCARFDIAQHHRGDRASWCALELDFAREAASTERIRAALAGDPTVRVPRIHARVHHREAARPRVPRRHQGRRPRAAARRRPRPRRGGAPHRPRSTRA